MQLSIIAVVLTCQIGSNAQQANPQNKPPEAGQDIEVPAAPMEPVELLDGAPTAEAALKAMVAASSAGDDEAAFLMVDPAIRPLLVPDMAIERIVIDSAILEYGSFGKPEFEVGGMLFWFTLRDLFCIRSIELLDTRTVDERRIVFTVRTIEKSSHSQSYIHNERQILAIRRAHKWYVFRPYGQLVSLLRGDALMLPDEKLPAVIRVNRSTDEESRTAFQIQYLVPIELVHEHLAEAARAPEFYRFGLTAEKLRRQFNSIMTRTKRGDYKTRRDLKSALSELENGRDELAGVNVVLSPGLRAFAKLHLPEKAESATQSMNKTGTLPISTGLGAPPE